MINIQHSALYDAIDSKNIILLESSFQRVTEEEFMQEGFLGSIIKRTSTVLTPQPIRIDISGRKVSKSHRALLVSAMKDVFKKHSYMDMAELQVIVEETFRGNMLDYHTSLIDHVKNDSKVIISNTKILLDNVREIHATKSITPPKGYSHKTLNDIYRQAMELQSKYLSGTHQKAQIGKLFGSKAELEKEFNLTFRGPVLDFRTPYVIHDQVNILAKELKELSTLELNGSRADIHELSENTLILAKAVSANAKLWFLLHNHINISDHIFVTLSNTLMGTMIHPA